MVSTFCRIVGVVHPDPGVATATFHDRDERPGRAVATGAVYAAVGAVAGPSRDRAAAGAADGRPKLDVARWRYDIASRKWWWSPGIYATYGYEVEQVAPTTALILAHLHPDDRERIAAELDALRTRGEPHCSWHRIYDASRREHTLITSGAGVFDDAGRLSEVRGFLVDITTMLHQDPSGMIRRTRQLPMTDPVSIGRANTMAMAANDTAGPATTDRIQQLAPRRLSQHKPGR